MKKYFIKTVILFLAVCFSIQQTNAQRRGVGGGGGGTVTISGSTSVYQNDVKTYTANPSSGLTIYSAFWTVGGGTIQSQSTTSVTILWTTTGTHQLDYEATSTNSGYVQANLNVTVSAAAAPPTPGSPTISSQNCTSATLARSGNPSSGIYWYWQGTNGSGTSTSYNATSNYTATSSGTYYIRAKNSSSGVWSASSASVVVTLGSIGGTTWYADYDGDGYGDPNDTETGCNQPANFVSNSSDACPNDHGGSNSNGCSTPVSLSDENYVYTVTPQVATTSIPTNTNSSDYITGVTYIDGLGRAKQSIAIRQSATSKDIVTHIEYNTLGQLEKEYLPYVPSATGDGLIKASALSETNTYYTNNYATSNPYSQKTIEASPLNRVLEQAAPGNDWKKTATNVTGKKYSTGQTNKMEYDTSISLEVKRYNVTTIFTSNTYEPTLVDNGHYLAGSLYKAITKDENWVDGQAYPKEHTIEIFKNKKGQLVLKRTYGASVVNGTAQNGVAHDTYYVYDSYGNLSYVLPPKSEASINKPTTTELNDLCYQYKYDYKKRQVEKRVPGRDGWNYIIYDNLDRQILTQSPELRQTNKWTFIKFDKLGRAVYSGIYTDGSSLSQTQMQSHVNTENNFASEYYEAKLTSPGALGIYYTNNNFPKTSIEVLTINYFDNYVFDTAGVASSITSYGVNSTTNTKGLPTGTKVKVLEESSWSTSVSFYDKKARTIYNYAYNGFLLTTDILQSKLDFVGKVKETTTSHTYANDNLPTQTVKDVFTYDHVGRLKTQKQYLNGASTGEFIVDNTYNELGQLKTKGVGGITTRSNRLQTVDYTYNVRGWLKTINQDTNNDNDLFNFSISYNDITDPTKKLFNGNISQTSWNTLNTDSSTKTYIYTYDALDRITKGDFNVNTYDLTNVSYDKNGNIWSLQRNKHSSAGGNDSFTYNYTDSGNKTNQLMSLSGTASSTFLYDKNGNMTKDTRKSITSIIYNYLDLPRVVTIGGQTITYTYDALGTKLRKVYGITITDYAGNYTYINSSLNYFSNTEGYFRVTSTGSTLVGNYVYQYKDHLESIRLSYADNNNDGVITAGTEIVKESNYYPYGVRHLGYNGGIYSTNLGEKKQFTGAEYQDDNSIDWYDVSARNYDPTLGRWMNLDPLAEQMRSISPYNYAFNSPMLFTDPDGMSPRIAKDLKDVPTISDLMNAYKHSWGGVSGTKNAWGGSGFSNGGTSGEDFTTIYRVYQNEDGTYSARKGRTHHDGKNDIQYQVYNKEGLVTGIYNGNEAILDMLKDGIKLTYIDYNNGSFVTNLRKTSEDFWTSDEFRTRKARETLVAYVSSFIPAEGLFTSSLSAGKFAFWSGHGTEMIAISNGFRVIGRTRAGRNMQGLISGMTKGQSATAWDTLSAALANSYKRGSTAHVFLSRSFMENKIKFAQSTWIRIERDILIKKGVNIKYHYIK
jgi:RHS repeat-associated protein